MTTFESRYNERLACIRQEFEEIPGLQATLDGLESGLSDEWRNAAPDKYYATKTKIADLKKEILRRQTAEIEYIVQATPYIKEYTTMVHAKEDAKSRPMSEPPKTRQQSPPRAQPPRAQSRPQTRLPKGLEGFVQVGGVCNNQQIFNKYLMEVEGDISCQAKPLPDGKYEDEECPTCQGCMVVNTREAYIVCEGCGYTTKYTEYSNANMTYDQETSQTVINAFAYQRSNHFSEWLASLQAKENTDIPPEVIQAVSAEFKKIKATTRNDITPDKVRGFLKKLRLQKYYEHTNVICTELNGVPAPKLPSSLEEKLKRMFVEIQEPFRKHCPSTRKNFLSYSYVLYKFCQLLGADEYLPFFPLLKSTEKLWLQDQIWKNICKELQWQFIRSC